MNDATVRSDIEKRNGNRFNDKEKHGLARSGQQKRVDECILARERMASMARMVRMARCGG